MKKILLVICFISFAKISMSQAYSYLGTFNSLGVPNYLTTNDVIPANLLTTIAASLPENFPVPTYHPSYIATGTNSNIVMQSSGHVWVTFVDEGAGYKNVLGYYSYPTVTPPASIPSNNNLKIVFPNVSKLNSGGGLVAGNKVYLGHFNAGTTISWFLIADGYRNGAVTNGNWRLFSNPAFNPESNAALKYHNVLLYDTTYDKIILGFEDIRRDYASCDNDFNDAIFYVSATPDTAIFTGGMNKTTNPTANVSTGNNGGLESNGSLSELISKRYYQRQQTPTLENLESQQNEKNLLNAKSRGMNQYVPNLATIGFVSYPSTPSDLVGVTNAVDILSVDYYDSMNKRQAVLLMTETENKVYNHTKSICDRLKNASITNIEQKQIAGIDFITYSMQQAEGEYEYITCFSLSNHQNQLTIHNQWLIGQYPEKDQFINFQVWSVVPHINQYIVEQILDQIATIKPYTVDSSAKMIPSVYFKKGIIDENKIHFELMNNSATTDANIVFGYTISEQDQRRIMSYPVKLVPNGTTMITIPFDGLFDADIQLEVNNIPIDEMYLADGAWGTDFPSGTTQIDNFIVNADLMHKSEGTYPVQRSAEVKATIQEYLTLYKMLKPSNLPISMNEYDYLNFTITNTDNVWIRLNKKSISEWAKQPKCQIGSSDSIKSISIPLSYFKNELGESIATNDLVSLSFTILAQKATNSSLSVKNVSFSKNPLNTVYERTNNLTAYPNPVINKMPVDIHYSSDDATEGIVEVLSITGSSIISQAISASKGFNTLSLQLPNSIIPGIYLIQLKLSNKTERIKLSVE